LGFIKKASTVIISMDADREGEMIARELLELANFRGKIQRCWLTALAPENIRKALTTLKNNQKTESLPGDNSSLQH
jgi:DNA topoisomerase